MRSLFTLVPVIVLALSLPVQAHVPTSLTIPKLDFSRDIPACAQPSADAGNPGAVPEPSAISLGIVAAALFGCLWQRQRCANQARTEQEKPSQRWNRRRQS
jgi:hypothetical protein